MAGSIQTALSSLGARLRKRRAVLIVLFGWLLLAQTLLVVHRIDHAKAEHGVLCALCSAADHSAGSAVEIVHSIAPQTPAPVAATVDVSLPVAVASSYRSRAPPTYLES